MIYQHNSMVLQHHLVLQNKGQDIDTITAGNAIILINDIFQGPQRLGNQITTIDGNYKIEQHNGDTQTLLGV